MKGAIIGDIVGSVYEGNPTKREDFQLFSEQSTFTDDTVLTIATAEALLNNREYAQYYRKWGRKYPDAGFGAGFYKWLFTENVDPVSRVAPPYNSWGNGGAMRVSPVGFAFDTPEEVEKEAERTAMASHSHPEGVKGAKAIATAVFLARNNYSISDIKSYLESHFHYDLRREFEEVRKEHHFDVSAAGSVPPALIAFFASENFEDTIRKAVSLGGDADTQACMAGAIAYAYYQEVPGYIDQKIRNILTDEMRQVMDAFNKKYKINY